MRRLLAFAAVGVALWIAAVVWWATSDWSDTQPLDTPPKVDVADATFTCGPVFDDRRPAELDGPQPPHPLTREPCGDRNGRRLLAIGDIALGVAAGTGLLLVGRRSGRPSDAPSPTAS